MILTTLKEYYDRKSADPQAQMAPQGFEWKEIPYVLVLDQSGNPANFYSTYEGSGKTRRAKRFLVPQSVKRASGVAANLLWDTPAYALGIGGKDKPERTSQQHVAFAERVKRLGNVCDVGLTAVKKFLDMSDKAALADRFGDEWNKMLEEGGLVSFQLAGETALIPESDVVRAAVSAQPDESEQKAVCLISGQCDVVERLHASIKGVWGAQPSGASIVSFNLDAFTSYGKKQGANAPVGKTSAFAYTCALNHLLSKDSKQRMQVGDASTVFWAEKPTQLEDDFAAFFEEPPRDDPDRNTRAIASLFRSPVLGVYPDDGDDTRFYVLGLAPNASRIAVRFWIPSTVREMSGNIRRHFDDIRIVHGPKDRDELSLFRLLVSTAALGKSDNIPPNLGGDLARAVFQGLPYPQTLLQGAIRRIRAEHEISHARAALIKAIVNRSIRSGSSTSEKELTVSLDQSNINIGYRLGRLFAVLEKVQQEASPGINATIRDRFYGAASGTPVTVFGNLMRLKNHHLAKLENPGRRVNLERLIGDIMSGIRDFPAHLALADQGRFAIGYYHQMQDFFTKKNSNQGE